MIRLFYILTVFLVASFSVQSKAGSSNLPDISKLNVCLIYYNNTGAEHALTDCAYPALNDLTNKLSNFDTGKFENKLTPSISAIKKLQDDCLIASTKTNLNASLKKDQLFCEMIYTNMLITLLQQN